MRWSKALIPTLKEDPKEAETLSHKLLLRAGFIRQHASGIYIFLPLGWRVMLKIAQIIREEMNAIGAQELFMPALTAAELWQETGRWEAFGDDMFRLKDRKNRDLALAPTHEEIIAAIARNEIRSYRDLPQIWYQMQTKFRDEPRPRGGLLRCREFIMKDSYSLDASWEGLDESYELHRKAYEAIFRRSGLDFVTVSASSGLMGGSQSEEFMVLSPSGEDKLVLCENCGYAANMEVAEGVPTPPPQSPYKELKKVHTPNIRTVEEVTAFLNVPPSLLIKSLVYLTPKGPVLVLVRGDHEVNEAKLAQVLGQGARLATPEEVEAAFGVSVGFVGPVGLPVEEIIADPAIRDLQGAVTGANEDDYHLVGVNVGEHFQVTRYVDIRTVGEGERCVRCGAPLKVLNAIEIGHIFKLGTKYSEALGVYFSDRDGKEKPVIMGSYGIGLGRIMASAIELYADEDGIVWPTTIAPMDVELLEVNPAASGEVAEKLYRELQEKGLEVLWDDRNISPGSKFKDADLVGLPLRITLGRLLAEGKAEIRIRRTGETHVAPLTEVTSKAIQILQELKRKDAGLA